MFRFVRYVEWATSLVTGHLRVHRQSASASSVPSLWDLTLTRRKSLVQRVQTNSERVVGDGKQP
jgi:hypothetical protein